MDSGRMLKTNAVDAKRPPPPLSGKIRGGHADKVVRQVA